MRLSAGIGIQHPENAAHPGVTGRGCAEADPAHAMTALMMRMRFMILS
jgi:hypothetical protein